MFTRKTIARLYQGLEIKHFSTDPWARGSSSLMGTKLKDMMF